MTGYALGNPVQANKATTLFIQGVQLDGSNTTSGGDQFLAVLIM